MRQPATGDSTIEQQLAAIGYRLSAILSLAVLLSACASAAAAPAQPLLTGALALHTPVQVEAGAPAEVHVLRPDAPDGLAATLLAQGSYGPQVYSAAFAQGQASFVLPGEQTRRAGLVTLIASAGAARGEARIVIRAGPPTDPITPLVGPRSIAADGEQTSMVVAIPFDGYGNPLPDDTPLELRALRPDGSLDAATLRVRHLVAWRRLTSGTRAGRTAISVAAAGAHGPEATFSETPGWPLAFAISASPATAPADGQQLITLRSETIRDRFGNPLPDGTLITFVVRPPAGPPSFIPAYTIDGIAKAQLQAPSEPGILIVRATPFDTRSTPLQISFTAGLATPEIPLAVHVNGHEGYVALAVGPLLGPLGQFVPDGTPVLFRVSGPDGTARDSAGEAEGGRAHAELRMAELPAGRYSVEARVGAGRGHAAFEVP